MPELSKENNNKKVIETFFKIWIIKGFLYDNTFEKYLYTFLDENNNFSNDLVLEKMDFIFNLISKNNATAINPNNLDEIDKSIVYDVLKGHNSTFLDLSNFSDEIITLIQGKTISMKIDYDLDEKKLNSIKEGLSNYLNELYFDGFYSSETYQTIEDIINKIISIVDINNNK